MSLDEIINLNYHKCYNPTITQHRQLCNMYWQGIITYKQYLEKLQEIKENDKANQS